MVPDLRGRSPACRPPRMASASWPSCRRCRSRPIGQAAWCSPPEASTGKLLVLREGTVEVVIDGERIAEVSEPGAVFGELALLLGRPHGADVRALGPTSFYVADGASYLRADPGAALYLATVLARRVAEVDRHLVAARSRLRSAPAGRVIDEMMDNIAEALRFGPPL